jgi:hypothetical protein
MAPGTMGAIRAVYPELREVALATCSEPWAVTLPLTLSGCSLQDVRRLCLHVAAAVRNSTGAVAVTEAAADAVRAITEPPSASECVAILGGIEGSLALWEPKRVGAGADVTDGIALLMVHLDVTTIPAARFNELYTSPIDAAEDVALVRDTLADRVGAGYRRDSIRAAAGLLRHALRAYVAPPLSELSTSHADVSAHDGEAVRAARGA